MSAFYGFPTSSAEDGHLRVVYATEPGHVAAVRELVVEYGDWLGEDLNFQGFAEELAGLPGDYVPPQGALLLALADGVPAACVALRPLEGDIAEMKRMYVRPAHRGSGLGGRMAQAIVAEARRLGYRRLRLDTLPKLVAAIGLYRRLGFREIPPYYNNPIPGVTFFEMEL